MCQTANDMWSEMQLRELENEYRCVDWPITYPDKHDKFTTISVQRKFVLLAVNCFKFHDHEC